MRLRPFLVLCLVFFVTSPAPAAVRPARGYKNGAVAADHRLASTVGVALLKQGGNAVDAVCGTAFALGVVNPTGSGIGGGGFMLILRPRDPTPVVLDFRETAPAAASREMYTRKGAPKHASRIGGLAVGVPGEVLGCAEAVKRFGKLSLARVLAPAIRLARGGFPVGRHLARGVREEKKEIARHPDLARLFLPKGQPIEARQKLRRPSLARSLEAIARKGPRVFYEGWIAKDLVQAVKASGGLLTLEDLKGYRIKERKPLTTTYRGYTVHTMPPPSSGGVALIETLNILALHKPDKLGHNSSRHLHLLTEALKHAFADRARYLGDPDFVKVPVGRLTSARYARELDKRIGEHVAPITSYGTPPPAAPSGDRKGTSHISVVDRDGMAVAMTTTVNTVFGSMVVGKASGIILNNQMDDFAAQPGKPNAFGLIQGEQNAVAPGKRPLSSMTPTIVTRDGRPVLVVGASGGPTIITGTLQALSNVLDFHREAAAAVSLPRVHHQWMPDKLVVERDLPRDVRDALKRRGHRVKVTRHPFTAVQVVVVGEDGRRFGASDPRKLGQPAGY